MKTTLPSPQNIKEKLPVSKDIAKKISLYRRSIRNILDYTDNRFMVIVGPCSFHDPIACLEYANKLKKLADEVAEKIFIVMRVYVEKPRTCSGWKGYLNDPYLNESYCIREGIVSTRQSMLDISEIGLPIASELLNPMAHLYFHDLLSWCAIGARTVESQLHREIASNLILPVGFKNTTTGNIKAAAHGIAFASRKQAFMGINYEGDIDVIHAPGNPYAHLVLRGSENDSNYAREDIINTEKLLSTLNLPGNIVVDCSHGNSTKNYLKQEAVFDEIIKQKIEGNQTIVGVILESFLKDGNQVIPRDTSQLQYGRSITDACINWEDTQRIIRAAYQMLAYVKSSPQRYEQITMQVCDI